MTRDRKEYYKQYYQQNKETITERKAVSGKAYREKHKESLKARNKEYYLKNKETICERTNANKKERYAKDPRADLAKQKQWKINNQEKYLVQNAKARAKKYGSAFDISAEDIHIPEFCPYLGLKLEPFSEWASPSLDKINPKLGYVKGNIQVISNLANTMKSSANIEQLVLFAQNVLKLHKGKDTL
jgi:hypothetical protein